MCAAGRLGEGQIPELVENHEVEPGKVVGHTALPPGARLGLELVDEVDDIEEPPADAVADAGPGDADREMDTRNNLPDRAAL